MDQRLIAIIVSFGFRFVLLAIPALDNFWIWTMRRFWNWCNSGAAADPVESHEGGQQIVQLQVMTAERSSSGRRLSDDLEGGIIITIIIVIVLLQLTF